MVGKEEGECIMMGGGAFEQREERMSETPARLNLAASIISDPYFLNAPLHCVPYKVSECHTV